MAPEDRNGSAIMDRMLKMLTGLVARIFRPRPETATAFAVPLNPTTGKTITDTEMLDWLDWQSGCSSRVAFRQFGVWCLAEVPFGCDEWNAAPPRVRQAIADAMSTPATDTQSLDWLDRQTGSGKLRWWKSGHDWRLSEMLRDDGAVPTVREAIADAMWDEAVAEANWSKAMVRGIMNDWLMGR